MKLYLFEYRGRMQVTELIKDVRESKKSFIDELYSKQYRKSQEDEIVELRSTRGFVFFTTNKEQYEGMRIVLFDKAIAETQETINRYTGIKNKFIKQKEIKDGL